MKRILSLIMAIAMMFTLVACGSTNQSAGETTFQAAQELEEATKAVTSNGKIGIITATVALNEELYRTAEAMVKRYGEDRVVIQTYPVQFMKEQETVISNLMSLVSDPEIKAVVFIEAISGASAAIAKAKEKRPDVLYIASGIGEDPQVAAAAADIIIDNNTNKNGQSLAQRAYELGAETFVYYSFPRHQAIDKINYEGRMMEETSEKLGIKFVRVTMPDPQSDAGTAGTQQFCLEDVPKQIEKYGPKTAFYDTNPLSMPAVAKAVLENGGIYPNPCNSSPFQYATPFGIEVPEDKQADVDWMMDEVRNFLAESGNSGRFSCRVAPVGINLMKTSVAYANAYIEGKTNGKVDMDALRSIYADIMESSPEDVDFELYDNPETGLKFDNYALILPGWADL